ncbi:MAG: hypothetical protein AAF697_01995 [Pseudomonadota bacterium]
MRLCAGFAAASTLLVAPLSAQDEDQPPAQPPTQHAPAFAPEEDLDCAIYVSALIAESQVKMTPESRAALTGAFTYFVGRYESQRGNLRAQIMVDRYPIYAERDPQEVQQTCSIRARALGQRLERVGRAIAEADGDQASEPSPE